MSYHESALVVFMTHAELWRMVADYDALFRTHHESWWLITTHCDQCFFILTQADWSRCILTRIAFSKYLLHVILNSFEHFSGPRLYTVDCETNSVEMHQCEARREPIHCEPRNLTKQIVFNFISNSNIQSMGWIQL